MEERLARLKILLGERADGYSDSYLTLLLQEAEAEALAVTRRPEPGPGEALPPGLEAAIPRMALVKANRTGSEGAASQGFSGVSESYLDGYPAEIQAVLCRYRKLVLR